LLSLIFFQAEDGIRDFHVTGVQTCALPILLFCCFHIHRRFFLKSVHKSWNVEVEIILFYLLQRRHMTVLWNFSKPLIRIHYFLRSEERRVGIERSYRCEALAYNGVGAD